MNKKHPFNAYIHMWYSDMQIDNSEINVCFSAIALGQSCQFETIKYLD